MEGGSLPGPLTKLLLFIHWRGKEWYVHLKYIMSDITSIELYTIRVRRIHIAATQVLWISCVGMLQMPTS